MDRLLKTLLLFLLNLTLAGAQPWQNAHAHNDYEHERPLFLALENGFISVEADIYLVRGRLIVSHLWPIFQSRTLEDLYLRPLDSLVRANNGSVYARTTGTFYLMVDIKSDGAEVYPVLLALLHKYPALFRGQYPFRAVTIFLSGERPIDLVLKDPFRRLSLDGRPADLGHNYPTDIMPIVSENYTKLCKWNGQGKPGEGDLDQVLSLASRVHAQGKKLRLWEIPDQPACWDALLGAGVDLINSDKLAGLSRFLLEASNRTK